MIWPFKTYSDLKKERDNLLRELQNNDHHYWKQAAINGTWERRAIKAEAELEKLKK